MAATIKAKQPGNIDGYIAGFPEQIRKKLEDMRAIVKKAAPGAVETINYGVPTLILSGNLVHFGGFKNHIGFYPAPSGIEAFKKELSVYEGAKGSVKFPVGQTTTRSSYHKDCKVQGKGKFGKGKAKIEEMKYQILNDSI
jgi:uncharacterized protein YdhG (YjbR/CyaY superfamily)